MSDYLLTSPLRVLGDCQIKIIYLITLHQKSKFKTKGNLYIEPF